MRLLLPEPMLKRLLQELEGGGRREIGGLLMGEHVGEDTFRLVDLSVQHSGGTGGCFTRTPKRHAKQLDEFFLRTGHEYGRFNYLGEWHSHPSFEVIPSATDIATMQSLVEDADTGVNFLVLLICRLDHAQLNISATAFRPGALPVAVELAYEQEEGKAEVSGRTDLSCEAE